MGESGDKRLRIGRRRERLKPDGTDNDETVFIPWKDTCPEKKIRANVYTKKCSFKSMGYSDSLDNLILGLP